MKHNLIQTKSLAQFTNIHFHKWLKDSFALQEHFNKFNEIDSKPSDDPVSIRYLQEVQANIICRHCYKEASYYPETAFIYGEDRGAVFYCGCIPGGVYVNCHKTDVAGNLRTTDRQRIPLGMLADKHLRKQRQNLHIVFDALWEEMVPRFQQLNSETLPNSIRTMAYKLLAIEMKIKDSRFCHIAWFNSTQCRKAMKICNTHSIKKKFHTMLKLYAFSGIEMNETSLISYMELFNEEVIADFRKHQRDLRKSKSPRRKRANKK